MSDFTIRPDWYFSRERAAQEWTHVWAGLWHMGPRLSELPEAGDTMLHTLGRESLIFVRDAANAVRGYYNVCRHRGNRLLLGPDAPGHVRDFQCAFHGWRFDLDGALADVPYRERFDCAALADPQHAKLAEFRIAEWAGWVWFTLNPDAPDFLDYLGPLRGQLDAYRMERAQIVDYKTFDFGCNWKTCFDAFHESYHFQTLHSDILAWGNEDAPITLLGIHSMMVNEYGRPSKLYGDQTALNPALAALLQMNGVDPAAFSGRAGDVRAAVRDAKRASGSTIFPYASLNDSQLTDAHHYTLFPALHFNLFPEFFVAMRYRPHPGGDPERMYYDFILCCPTEADEIVPPYDHAIVRGGAVPVTDVLQWGRWKHPVVEQVLGEDVGLVEHVQLGQHSQSFHAPLLSQDERRIGHFHRMIDDLITGRKTLRDLMSELPVEADAHPGT